MGVKAQERMTPHGRGVRERSLVRVLGTRAVQSCVACLKVMWLVRTGKGGPALDRRRVRRGSVTGVQGEDEEHCWHRRAGVSTVVKEATTRGGCVATRRLKSEVFRAELREWNAGRLRQRLTALRAEGS